MKREAARFLHTATNKFHWMEESDYVSENPIKNAELIALRALPFSVHKLQKRVFFRNHNLLAVNGESVVYAAGDQVNKFMFRYPGDMDVETFFGHVRHEVGAVTGFLAGVALPTEVSLRPARVFRFLGPLMTVTQTQERLDMTDHAALDMDALAEEVRSERLDKTAHGLEMLVCGAERLFDEYGLYPDINPSSGNLRRSATDGTVTLIDVMPAYASGTRLIGDRPGSYIENINASLGNFKAFAGQYGA